MILLVLNTTFSHKDTDFPLFYNEYSDYTDDTVMTIANADWLITEESLPTHTDRQAFFIKLSHVLIHVYIATKCKNVVSWQVCRCA